MELSVDGGSPADPDASCAGQRPGGAEIAPAFPPSRAPRRAAPRAYLVRGNRSLYTKRGRSVAPDRPTLGPDLQAKGSPARCSTDGHCGLRSGAERGTPDMRKKHGGNLETRASALWGRGGRGSDVRANTLGTLRSRGTTALAALLVVLAIPTAAIAASAGGGGNSGDTTAFLPPSLLAQAQANPDQIFHVIVQGTKGQSSDDVTNESNGEGGQSKHQFLSINGAAGDINRARPLQLAPPPHLPPVTPDAPRPA